MPISRAVELLVYTSANRLTADDARRAAEVLEQRGEPHGAEALRRAADEADG